ncbi:MAG: phospholipase [Pseudomonadota bacterium]
MTSAAIEKSYDVGPASGGEVKSIVVMLHGVGSNGQDLISLAPFWAESLPDTLFVSPDAPFACDMVPEGYPNSYQWFSLQSRDPHDMLKGVEDTMPIVEHFLDALLEKHGVSADKLALLGFSQGTMTSLYVGPRYSKKIAGILGYSGALIGGEGLAQDPDEFHRMPIHLIHGEADDVVPVEMYGHAKEQLGAAGYTVTGGTTPNLTHGIDEAGIQSGGEFLKSIFE